MDEARRVIDRLWRIEALRAAGAEPRMLLDELRELVREGHEWIDVEGRTAAAAVAALTSLEDALTERPGHARGAVAREEVVIGEAAL